MGEAVRVLRKKTGPQQLCSFCALTILSSESRVVVEHLDKYLPQTRFEFFHVDCSDGYVDKVFDGIVRHWKKTGSPFAVAS